MPALSSFSTDLALHITLTKLIKWRTVSRYSLFMKRTESLPAWGSNSSYFHLHFSQQNNTNIEQETRPNNKEVLYVCYHKKKKKKKVNTYSFSCFIVSFWFLMYVFSWKLNCLEKARHFVRTTDLGQEKYLCYTDPRARFNFKRSKWLGKLQSQRTNAESSCIHSQVVQNTCTYNLEINRAIPLQYTLTHKDPGLKILSCKSFRIGKSSTQIYRYFVCIQE